MKPLCLPLMLGAISAATPAAAQLVVHDPTNYGSLLRQAQTALDQLNAMKAQLEESRRLYDGFNTASGAGGLAPRLTTPELRDFIPNLDAYVAAARGDLGGLGTLGAQAKGIREGARLHAAPADPDLERQGDRAARDLAVGLAAARAGGERLTGLQDLASAVDAAPNVRAVMDLQARVSAEQALIANDQMRLQGLAMAQAAEDRLQAQRLRERAAAASEARLQLYRRSIR